MTALASLVMRAAAIALAVMNLQCQVEGGAINTSTTQCIFYGTAFDEYLQLSADNTAAIRLLKIGPFVDGTYGVCSGVMIAADWLLTARHCVKQAKVQLSDGLCQKVPSVVNIHEHPDLDVALLELETGVGHTPWLPLSSSHHIEIGAPLELAGYGLTESEEFGMLRFVVELIDQVSATELIVDGGGVSGACVGDSGGPVLQRGLDGRVEVVGILSTGSASCAGTDRYVRADALTEWVDSFTGDIPAAANVGCDGLSSAGGCYQGQAVWCGGIGIEHEECDNATTCTFDASKLRYACVAASESPCGGEDALGRCDGEVARRCEDGELVVQHCQSCSLSQGYATCL